MKSKAVIKPAGSVCHRLQNLEAVDDCRSTSSKDAKVTGVSFTALSDNRWGSQ
jgi:hypothetical protein